MASVIAFDVNETLLDLHALDEPFETLLGSASLRPQWFSLMLQLAFTGGLTGHVDFTSAQRAALAMLAEREGVPVTAGDIDGLVSRMSPCPRIRGARCAGCPGPHPAAAGGPDQLRPAHRRGSTWPAGLAGLFQAVLSADATGHLKPAPQPYHAVAERCGVPIGQVRLVAAHSWASPGPWPPHARPHSSPVPAWCSAHSATRPVSPAGPGRGSRADHQHRRVKPATSPAIAQQQTCQARIFTRRPYGPVPSDDQRAAPSSATRACLTPTVSG